MTMSTQATTHAMFLLIVVALTNFLTLTTSVSPSPSPSPLPSRLTLPPPTAPQPAHTPPKLCLATLRPLKCEAQIQKSIYTNHRVSDRCCNAVIAMRPPCFAQIVEAYPKFKGNVSLAKKKSKKAWTQCNKYLKKCLDIPIRARCMGEFIRGIKKGHVANRCCLTMVKMGKLCYRGILRKYHARHQFHGNGTEFWSKVDNIWKNCTLITKGPWFS